MSLPDDRLTPTKAAHAIREIEQYLNSIITLSENATRPEMEALDCAFVEWEFLGTSCHYAAEDATDHTESVEMDRQFEMAAENRGWCMMRLDECCDGSTVTGQSGEQVIVGHRQLMRLIRQIMYTVLFEYDKDPNMVWCGDNGELVYDGVQLIMDRLERSLVKWHYPGHEDGPYKGGCVRCGHRAAGTCDED